MSLQNSPGQAIEMPAEKRMITKPDLELELPEEKIIERTNTVLGIVEERPKELFNLNERTIAESNDGT